MSKVGGLTRKYYKETSGLKVSGGQFVKKGTVLTRNGDRWKPGHNVIGKMHLNAACDGEVYFTKKRGSYRNRTITFIHVRPGTSASEPASKKAAGPKPKAAKSKVTKPAASKAKAPKSQAKKTTKSKE